MKHAITILTLAVFVLVGMPLTAEHTKPFKMTLWGTAGIPLGSTIGENQLGLSLCRGDSNFGKFECTTTGYSKMAPSTTVACPDGGTPMDFVEVVSNHVIRFENGDVLYMVPDMTKHNYVCFYSSGYAFQVANWKIVGGSGRFKGATGSATWTLGGDALPLGPYFMWATHPGPMEGYITMQ